MMSYNGDTESRGAGVEVRIFYRFLFIKFSFPNYVNSKTINIIIYKAS